MRVGLEVDADADGRSMASAPGYWRGVGGRVVRDPVAVSCMVALGAMLVAMTLGDWITPHDPSQTSVARRLRPIGYPGHLLGTDELGRDMLSRLVVGGRMSWALGLTPVAIATLVGAFAGVVAGYLGGLANTLIMRTTDVFYAFPSILLAVAISGALGGGPLVVVVSLTLVFIPPIIRVSETVTTSVRGLDFVAAARASGAGHADVVRTQILPNVIGPILVYALGLLGISMVLSAGLSFLGLGAQPPAAEWGLMLNSLRTAIYSSPLVAALPGACIFATSLCFALLSDSIRSAMDVRSN